MRWTNESNENERLKKGPRGGRKSIFRARGHHVDLLCDEGDRPMGWGSEKRKKTGNTLGRRRSNQKAGALTEPLNRISNGRACRIEYKCLLALSQNPWRHSVTTIWGRKGGGSRWGFLMDLRLVRVLPLSSAPLPTIAELSRSTLQSLPTYTDGELFIFWKRTNSQILYPRTFLSDLLGKGRTL